MTDTTSFLLVLAAAAAAPFIAAGAGRLHPQVIVPIVVVELFLGALIGPDVLGLAEINDILDFLGQLGLGFLFFFAGYEIEFDRIRGEPLRLAVIGWLITLVLAYAIAGALPPPAWCSRGCSSARRCRRPRSARSSPSCATRASSRRGSGGSCSGSAPSASSGRC